MARPSRLASEVRDRAVRMVLEHMEQYDSQWAAITSLADVQAELDRRAK